MRAPRWRTGATIVAALAVVLGVGAFLATRGEAPQVAKDLDRLERAGDEASEHTRAIRENLEAIAANLQKGEEIGGRSDRIKDLTRQQRSSLERLADLLAAQLEATESAGDALEDTEEATAGIARLSDEQVALLERTVAALERLESFAGTAGRISAEVARLATYGARLAEDSERSFGWP